MVNENQQESVQHAHRNGRATQVNFHHINQIDSGLDILDAKAGSVRHAWSTLTVEPKHVLPLLLGAILAGAAFGFFWKRK